MNINLTLIGQSITFLLFVWFCKAFVWTAIRSAMDEREAQIADGLEAADRAGRDLELAQEKATQQLRKAKEEAASIIDAANKRATQIVEEAKDTAREEGDRLKVAAQAEIEQEANRAKEQLRGQVASLVLAGAEKVLESSIDEAQHKALVEKLAAGL
ncbi:F0F1 ATP synthase subunit B [Dasania sp. GY-MA-18]|uniref:ATP synthase subunit b n=1 Tax=Dasania phycosphaerae TaxID=2950436 RepID=A0A9J6RJM2_9GAMM|nr:MULTISPECIES: F0F1 ATP synthase subunit B [Dasania]MCR8921971.1 F0F1 ATP synthase subunit B [Dasania sp. GY-MA-18]MCZ0864399.1 F0F1 ATP synthase subunit B [Dasania phycosphaerae]MCZ0868127.1 F0F1 ATP synthase subunit B [Dasania phycosphaerae]